MADTYTTNLNLTKPEPGAAEDTWGISLNSDLDTLDAIFSSSGTQINLNPNQVNFADNKKAIFGTGSDLSIYHSGTNSHIADTGEGNLYLDATNLIVRNGTGTETYMTAANNGGVVLYHDNTSRFSTTSSGIDVTGTVTSDGLILDANTGLYGTDATLSNYSSTNGVYLNGNIGGWLRLGGDRTGNQRFDLFGNNGGGFIRALTQNKNRLDIANNGDISFYDDTGATQALFWDASAESLGIGITSPQGKLHINTESAEATNVYIDGEVSQDKLLRFRHYGNSEGAGATAYQGFIGSVIDDVLTLGHYNSSGTEVQVLHLTEAGKVGIGTSSPSYALTVVDSGNVASFGDGTRAFRVYTDADEVSLLADGSVPMKFYTSGAERARFDTSGNLLIGKTGTTFSNAGIEARENGNFRAIRDGGNTADFNRLTSDGNIAAFYKDGTAKAVIGSVYTGFGTSSPATPLHVYHSTINTIATFQSGDSGAGINLVDNGGTSTLQQTTDTLRIGVDEDGAVANSVIAFRVDGSEKGRFNSSGNLLVGGTSTTNSQGWGRQISSINSGTNGAALTLKDSNGEYQLASYANNFYLSQGANTRFFINSSGNIGVGTTSPNYLLDVEGTGSLFRINSTSGAAALQISVPDTTSLNDINFGDSGSTTSGQIRYRHDGDSMAFSTGGSERVRLDSSGRLGIGTTSPSEKLDIVSAGSVNMKLNNTGNNVSLSIGAQSSAARITAGSGDRLGLGAGNTQDILNIASGGNVGIGTTAPSTPLSVHSALTSGQAIAEFRSTGNSNATIDLRADGTGDTRIWFDLNGATPFAIGVDNSDSDKFKISGGPILGTNDRFVIDSSGNIGIGTSSPDAPLTVHNSSDPEIRFGYSSSQDHRINWDSSKLFIEADPDNANGSSAIGFRVDGSEKARIDSSGNLLVGKTSTSYANEGIALRADNNGVMSTVTNNFSFVANRLSSDGTLMLFAKDTSTVGRISTTGGDLLIGTGDCGIRFSDGGDQIRVCTDTGTNRDGAIDLGYTDSRFKDLHLSGTANIGSTTSVYEGAGGDAFFQNTNSGADLFLDSGRRIRFTANGSERARIDSSGNFLVGKTSTSVATVGAKIAPTGEITATVSGDKTLTLNRTTNDGALIQLRRDNTTKAQIGILSASAGNDAYFASGSSSSTGTGLRFISVTASTYVGPCRGDGTLADDLIDLGSSGSRFDDIYATNGTIQTSDRNEKQDIQELSDVEQRVATACKGLIRRYKFNSAVEEKGDDARYHFGIIAQDLQDAFTAEGLDAGDYGMFISDTYTDDNGIEQTRLGVRYNELLAFIIAAI